MVNCPKGNVRGMFSMRDCMGHEVAGDLCNINRILIIDVAWSERGPGLTPDGGDLI